MNRLTLWLAVPAFWTAFGASAHEVWIEPLNWQAAPSGAVQAHIRNGEYFDGFDLTWNDRQTVRAEAWVQDDMSAIEGRLGDRPALATQAAQEGLLALLYQSGYRTIVYDDFEKFTAFVTEKGHAPSVLEQHAARKLPETPVTEAYARFAKSLLAVGNGAGSDSLRGMELELVALTNPYVTGDTAAMAVRLFYRGAPLAGNKVTVFERAEDMSVTEIFLTTDADGRASFDVRPGMTYLVDSVVIREPSRALLAETPGAVWESLWASLTFRLPGPR